jgi:HEAT repeat protein
MPTETERRVLQMLSAIEVSPDAPALIEAMGTDAVTVVCEAALGTYEGVRLKVRSNAAAVVGRMSHPQALETLALLVNDASPDVATRAVRAIARRGDAHLVPRIAELLTQASTADWLAAEAVRALAAFDLPAAREALASYAATPPERLHHRGSAVVEAALARRPDR